jgi:hypothetical protein
LASGGNHSLQGYLNAFSLIGITAVLCFAKLILIAYSHVLTVKGSSGVSHKENHRLIIIPPSVAPFAGPLALALFCFKYGR